MRKKHSASRRSTSKSKRSTSKSKYDREKKQKYGGGKEQEDDREINQKDERVLSLKEKFATVEVIFGKILDYDKEFNGSDLESLYKLFLNICKKIPLNDKHLLMVDHIKFCFC